MSGKKKIFAIIGSASDNSSNLRLVEQIVLKTNNLFSWEIFDKLRKLPHFNPEQSVNNTPEIILDVREKINQADGILICTPEYVFSIPSGLKNLIEWCVSTTVFSRKPTALITASALGIKGHEELQLLMKTIEASFTDKTSLLIHGIKGKITLDGEISDRATKEAVENLLIEFEKILSST